MDIIMARSYHIAHSLINILHSAVLILHSALTLCRNIAPVS